MKGFFTLSTDNEMFAYIEDGSGPTTLSPEDHETEVGFDVVTLSVFIYLEAVLLHD